MVKFINDQCNGLGQLPHWQAWLFQFIDNTSPAVHKQTWHSHKQTCHNEFVSLLACLLQLRWQNSLLACLLHLTSGHGKIHYWPCIRLWRLTQDWFFKLIDNMNPAVTSRHSTVTKRHGTIHFITSMPPAAHYLRAKCLIMSGLLEVHFTLG